jgi:hypothetical protein
MSAAATAAKSAKIPAMIGWLATIRNTTAPAVQAGNPKLARISRRVRALRAGGRPRCPRSDRGNPRGPGPPVPARCRLPHRGGSDPVAELDELALRPPVPPRRVICCHADHELADRGCRGRPPGTPSARVIPLACGQPPVPGQQCRRGHREHLTPSPPRDQPGQCREPQPVDWLVADPADLAAKHHVLVPQHQEFGVLGHLTPGQHHQAAQQAGHKQVGDGEDHSAMIPTPNTAQAMPDRVTEPHRIKKG